MKIFISTKGDKQLDKLPSPMYRLILSKIEKLTDEPFPSGVKKIEGRLAWRIRVGDYRILYTVDMKKKELTILSVAHRRNAYKFYS